MAISYGRCNGKIITCCVRPLNQFFMAISYGRYNGKIITCCVRLLNQLFMTISYGRKIVFAIKRTLSLSPLILPFV